MKFIFVFIQIISCAFHSLWATNHHQAGNHAPNLQFDRLFNQNHHSDKVVHFTIENLASISTDASAPVEIRQSVGYFNQMEMELPDADYVLITNADNELVLHRMHPISSPETQATVNYSKPHLPHVSRAIQCDEIATETCHNAPPQIRLGSQTEMQKQGHVFGLTAFNHDALNSKTSVTNKQGAQRQVQVQTAHVPEAQSAQIELAPDDLDSPPPSGEHVQFVPNSLPLQQPNPKQPPQKFHKVLEYGNSEANSRHVRHVSDSELKRRHSKDNLSVYSASHPKSDARSVTSKSKSNRQRFKDSMRKLMPFHDSDDTDVDMLGMNYEYSTFFLNAHNSKDNCVQQLIPLVYEYTSVSFYSCRFRPAHHIAAKIRMHHLNQDTFRFLPILTLKPYFVTQAHLVDEHNQKIVVMNTKLSVFLFNIKGHGQLRIYGINKFKGAPFAVSLHFKENQIEYKFTSPFQLDYITSVELDNYTPPQVPDKKDKGQIKHVKVVDSLTLGHKRSRVFNVNLEPTYHVVLEFRPHQTSDGKHFEPMKITRHLKLLLDGDPHYFDECYLKRNSEYDFNYVGKIFSHIENFGKIKPKVVDFMIKEEYGQNLEWDVIKFIKKKTEKIEYVNFKVTAEWNNKMHFKESSTLTIIFKTDYLNVLFSDLKYELNHYEKHLLKQFGSIFIPVKLVKIHSFHYETDVPNAFKSLHIRRNNIEKTSIPFLKIAKKNTKP